jgi:septum formation inhibitor MinC
MGLFIKGKDRFLDQDELGMIRKMVRDKTKFSILNASQLEPDLTEIIASPSTNKSLLTSQPFLIINHSLRAGEEINTTSPVILHGDINPGAILKSSGPVIVTGRIKGDVIIQNASEGAFVYSSGLQPNRLSINSIDLPGTILTESDMLNASIIYCNQNTINILRLKEDKWEKQL